jgi:Ca-activated chloride channel family protein
MPALSLVRPEGLALFAAVAVLAALAVWVEVRRRRAVALFAGRGLEMASVSVGRRRAKLALAIAGAALTAVALVGPYLDVVERTVVQSGVDLVVALDVSQSMAVRDVDPDRLRAAKAFISKLGDGLSQSRVALVLFAGDGIVRYPPTADPKVLGQALDNIATAFKPAGGSSLRGAVDASLRAFSQEARDSTRRKAVVLLTDGEDLSGQAPDVEILRQRGVRLFAIGVGTPSGGPIPTYDRAGKFTGFLKRGNGEQITSRLVETGLVALAERTDGKYWRLDPGFATVNQVVTELERLDASRLGELPGGSIPNDRYQLFLALAIVLLIAEGLIDDRRGMPHPRWLRTPRAPRRWRIALPAFARVLGLLVIGAITTGACAETSSSDADRLYLAGDVPAALDRYKALVAARPDVPELHVNLGNAHHQLAQYPAALDAYAFGVREGEAPVRAVALYQRGNTFFRMGKLEEAREAYKAALRLDPRDRDAKFNIEVIDRALTPTIDQPGPPQPGQSGPPQPGRSGPPRPQPGQPGEQAPSSSGDPSQPGQDAQPPGSQGPQSSGAPSADTQLVGPSLSEVLRQFRSRLTTEEALLLLDALTREQRGVEILIEGPQPGPGQQRQDPTY